MEGQGSFLGEFNTLACQQRCFAYPMVCQGDYASAPCSCAWRHTSPRYRLCRECYLICLDRSVKALDGTIEDDALSQFRGGLPLNKLMLSQPPTADFPLFIPTRTSDFPSKTERLPLRWAAADVKQLWRARNLAGASLKPKFATEASTRAFLRVSDDCRLLAVLNGQDRYLESLWAMDDRIGKFQQLAASGFEASTGATFSVMHLTVEGTPVPQMHNITMQRRHNQVAQEIQQAGLMSAPNLYWFDEREQRQWIEWLLRHPAVSTISRDFSLTRYGPALWEQMNGLLHILECAGRSFHVLLVGTGPATAPDLLRTLAERGHTGTVITADPIMQGVKAKLYDSRMKAKTSKTRLRPELALENIELFETRLLDAVANYAVARNASRNLLLTSV